MAGWERVRRTWENSRDEAGASAVEYGLLVTAIAAVVVALMFALGGMTNGMFRGSCEHIRDIASPGSTC